MIARHDVQFDKTDLWSKLAAPLPVGVISWRQDGRPSQRDGKFFSRFVAYIEANTVRERLDSVVPGEWDLTLELLPPLPASDETGVRAALTTQTAEVDLQEGDAGLQSQRVDLVGDVVEQERDLRGGRETQRRALARLCRRGLLHLRDEPCKVDPEGVRELDHLSERRGALATEDA